MKIFDLLIKLKIIFDRGRYWFGYSTVFMLMFVAVSSLKQYSYFSFLGAWYWLVCLFLLSLFMMLGIGYVEMKYTKTIQKESKIYTLRNPVFMELLDNQKIIIDKLNELKK